MIYYHVWNVYYLFCSRNLFIILLFTFQWIAISDASPAVLLIFLLLSGPYTCKQFGQTECLHKHFDSVGCCLRACANCLREIKTVWYFCASSQCLRRLIACLHKQTSVLLGVDTMWLSAVVICSTIDHAMSSKGTAEERQFLIEFIEEYRSLPALWWVTSTEYSNRNKKNEQKAKLLKKYKGMYLNVEKKYVIKKLIQYKSVFKEGVKKNHTVVWATWRLAPHACTVCSCRQAICANKFAQIACTCRGRFKLIPL